MVTPHIILLMTIMQWPPTWRSSYMTINCESQYWLAIQCLWDLEFHEPHIINKGKRGAKVAMALALRSSNVLKALVSIDNAPVRAALKSNFSNYIEGLRQVEKARVLRQSEAEEILKTFEAVGLCIGPFSLRKSSKLMWSISQSLSVRRFLLTNLVRDPPERHLRLRIPLEIIASNLETLGDFLFKDPSEVKFEGPALFIRGTKSLYVSDDILPLIKGFFPKFQLLDIDSGHWVMSERPEAFREG